MPTDEVEVLLIAQVADSTVTRIAAISPRVRVVDARGWFDVEIGETWPAWTVQRYLAQREIPVSSRQERDRLLGSAEVVLAGWPPLLDMRARAPRLRWFHQLPAGASNLFNADLWGSDVIVTTSRGYGNTRAMAEYVLACFYNFARGLHCAYSDQRHHHFDHRSYRPIALDGKTVCVVGAGGIGKEVGRLCASVGMRVLGTRRRAIAGETPPPGFARLESPDRLHALLAESDCVAVCCQWTPETTNLIGREAFAAMKPGAILVNVARGEIIDEDALAVALNEGKLRGVALDVYVGEFERAPDRRLWDDERVLITPHVSGANDVGQHRGVDLFCDNLHAYLEGMPLTNVIDWSAGY
ncbi:MAG TPA: D-2-hydroxyacid dehydrogenase [Candidatus Binataceae bacterium]|nr:D-2-hydroxyacid dehydrogenase [Candidatus Binataceae bacterium]